MDEDAWLGTASDDTHIKFDGSGGIFDFLYGNYINFTVNRTDEYGPGIQTFKRSDTPAPNDQCGQWIYWGENDNDQDAAIASIKALITDETDGTEDGQWQVDIMVNGAVRAERFHVDGDGVDVTGTMTTDQTYFVPRSSGTATEGYMYSDSDDQHCYFYNGTAWKQVENACTDLYIEENGTLRQLGSLWRTSSVGDTKLSIPLQLTSGTLVALRIMCARGEVTILKKYNLYIRQSGKIKKLNPISEELLGDAYTQGSDIYIPHPGALRLVYDIPTDVQSGGFVAKGRLEDEFLLFDEANP
jgi:hypothetical protein